MAKVLRSGNAAALVGGLALLAGLCLSSLYSYLLFHSLTEVLTIAMAWAVFLLVWNSRRFLEDHYLLFVGLASLFVGAIDLLHTLAFKGMGVFAGSDANLPTQLWIAARYLQGIALFLAPFFLGRKLDTRWVAAGFGVATSLLIASIFVWHIFPDCYVEGRGLTPFKIGSEYLITLILFASLVLLYAYRRRLDQGVFRHLALFIGLTMAAELIFTLYITVYDISNLAGHLVRLVAAYFLYRAIVVTGLVRPYDLLFRDLQHRERDLATANARLEHTNAQLQGEVAERQLEIVARKRAEQSLRESEQRVRLKLESILSPEGDIGHLELADVIEAPAIQSLMDDFGKLVPIPMAIIDVTGRVLVGVGWQDICTRFHRAHPETRAHCIESDTRLSAGVRPGESRLYKCRNNMWDIASPILVGGQHIGNVFSGQFFFDDEVPDADVFRAQAKRYGFEEQAYLAALKRVPRLSRASVDQAVSFLIKLADLISKQSHSNLKLARSLAEQDTLTQSLREALQRIEKLNNNLGEQAEELQVANMSLEQQTEELQVANTHLEELLVREHSARTEAELGKRRLETSEQRIQALNEDLERRNTDLEIANRELEAFSYSVSHDLRTPLAAIDSFTRLLIQDFRAQLPEQALRYLELVRGNADAMSRLIEDLLALSRSSRQPLRKQRVRMAEMVRQVAETLGEAQAGRQVQLSVSSLPDCQADPGLIRQVWVNLLSNAFKFTREREVARIEIGYDAEDGEPAYFVRDNGVGFNRELADRLFGVFQRYHSSEEYEGTGVGLAIVERIVRRHGGHVWADAEVDHGATFRFTLE